MAIEDKSYRSVIWTKKAWIIKEIVDFKVKVKIVQDKRAEDKVAEKISPS